MPGSNRRPTRPRRWLSFSCDRLGLSNGAGIVGLVFGTLFSTTGLLTLYAAFGSVLVVVGLEPLPLTAAGDTLDQAWWQTLAAFAAVLIIGAGHLAFGCLLLTTLRCRIDRARGTVIVRYGWFGLRTRAARLSDFDHVSLLPAQRWFQYTNGVPAFDIVLIGPGKNRLLIGLATRCADVAREVAVKSVDSLICPLSDNFMQHRGVEKAIGPPANEAKKPRSLLEPRSSRSVGLNAVFLIGEHT